MAEADIRVEQQRRISLDEILKEENLVLVDGCGGHNYNGKGESFGVRLFEINSKTGIERDDIANMAHTLRDLREILDNPNVYTVPGVTNELRRLLEIIGEKCKYFSEKVGGLSRRTKRYFEICNNSLERLSQLQEEAYSTCKLAKSRDIRWCKDLSVRSHQFDSILEMIKLIDRAIGLKRDTAFMYGSHREDMSRKSDTDETLIGYLYCVSMFSDKKPVVLTADTDLIRLAGVTPGMMGAETFTPNNELFRKRLGENPFWLCFNENEKHGEYLVAVDSADSEFDKAFYVNNASPEKNAELICEMRKLWGAFNR